MAHYLVRAKPPQDLDVLRTLLNSGEIAAMRPFGTELQHVLEHARVDADGYATWEEQCFCSPPLKQEREVLDRFFTDLTTEIRSSGDAWAEIDHLPSLWPDA